MIRFNNSTGKLHIQRKIKLTTKAYSDVMPLKQSNLLPHKVHGHVKKVFSTIAPEKLEITVGEGERERAHSWG